MLSFAVMDLPVGNKDLQQCADAIMRLRAEYLYRPGQFNSIRFYDNNNDLLCLHGEIVQQGRF
jgi:hypothetical protein